MSERRAGILLHPSSLPGPHGIGSLGDEAERWLEFLERAGQRLWQVMPLGPTGFGDSPYQSFSAFAGNPYLIDLDRLVEAGWLTSDDFANEPEWPRNHVPFGELIPFKVALLRRAATRFRERADAEAREAVGAFGRAQAAWLDDFALFMALKEAHGGESWNRWPAPLRDRDADALEAAAEAHAEAVERHRLWQWFFYTQWRTIKRQANARDILVIGDLPIFVAYDSADVWANPELFHLDAKGNPTVVAGVPPDYFSATGQRWGNPLYRWDEMARRGFGWWIARMRAALESYDIVRIDHFRGFEAYWEIPASEPTAVKGRWVKGPGQALFSALREALGDALPIIAEDLGVITPAVEALRDANGFPGMKVLQFAFGSDASDPYLPHNYPKGCVVYTGTHDNDTTRGWYEKAPEAERDFARRYLARDGSTIAWDFVRLACSSVASSAIAPLQDVLGLGSEARMNTPGVAAGNWSWRFAWEDVPHWVAPQLYELSTLFGRLPSAGAVDTAYRQSVLTGEEAS